LVLSKGENVKLTDKQKEILQALVDGKDIEYYDANDWRPLPDVRYVSIWGDEYLRIKPEVPKDIIVTEFKKYLPKLEDAYNEHNVEYTYDGVTHELKSVRLLGVKANTDSKPQPDSEGWISNVGNDTQCWPEGYGINRDTKIEIKRRNGDIVKDHAYIWNVSWTETEGDDWNIVEFRIAKDQNE
jgi:hypothetical protein